MNDTASRFKPLYNGNISMMNVNIPKVGVSLQYAYSYDELNRLKESYAYQGLNTAANTWSPSLLQDLKEELSYDANGNILTLRRNGNNTLAGLPLYMDNLKYSYYYIKTNGLRGTYRPSEDVKPIDALTFTNQLSSVNDNQDNSVNYPNDIDNQSGSNYTYDAIGNLIKDNQAGINTISWNVYGKIKSIDKTGTAADISYAYDAAGNRVKKTVGTTQTYYIRDAQGNTLAVYEQSGSTTLWKEQQLYGSSRLGIWKPELNLASGTATLAWQQVGNKFFELSNHLGNVLSVISNKRHQSAGNTFEADVVSAQDYYAFGSHQPGRTYTAANSGYRYGFNGKENDNEVKGEGNQQDYGMRIYDTRLGRFLSVDPITASYPELTPYQFASNSPIAGIDLDGLEFSLSTYAFRESKITSVTADQVVRKVKDSPKQVLKNIEKAGPIGGGLMVVGYGFTIFGVPEVGIPMVKAGAVVAATSDVAEVANTFDEKGAKEGFKTAGKKAIFEVAGSVLKFPIDKINLKNVDEVLPKIDVDKEILKTGVDLKVKLAEILMGTVQQKPDKPTPTIVPERKK